MLHLNLACSTCRMLSTNACMRPCLQQLDGAQLVILRCFSGDGEQVWLHLISCALQIGVMSNNHFLIWLTLVECGQAADSCCSCCTSSPVQSSDEDTDCSSEEDGPLPGRQPLIPLPSQPGAPSLIQKLKLARGSDSAKPVSGSIPAVWGSETMHSGTQLAVAGRQLSGGHLVPKLCLEGAWHSTAEQRERLAQVRHFSTCKTRGFRHGTAVLDVRGQTSSSCLSI